jgi:Domain of Unknown Function with PDB structure (DUF3857)/Transglutaminase-like superfamily
MLRRRCLFGILAAFLLSPVRAALALDDWQPINQDELKMKADPAHPADAIMLYHEELSNDLTGHAYVYKRIKIFTEKGRRWANVEIAYEGNDFGISDVKGRTIAPDGSITPFDGKTYNSTIAKGHGVKYLAKTFTLPNVEVGSIIEWKYTEYWDTHALHAPHWTVQEDLYQKRAKFSFVPFIKAGYSVESERGTLDQIFSQTIGMPPNAAIKSGQGQDNRMELELTDIPAFEYEDYSPPSAVMKMRVNFYYGTGKMAKPAEFWKEEGKYWNKQVEKFIGHSSAVAAAANQAVSAGDSPEQKVRKIYAQVQKMKNLTYMLEAVSMDEMLSQQSRQKRTLEDVLHNNAGYRDELSRLFVAMVRAVNIPAYEMRVADRDANFFQATIPNPHQLTSEIAIVPLDGKDVFLDPGTPSCPFGLLKWQHTGTQGLRQLPGGNADLAKTEPPTYKEAVSRRVGRLTLTEDGNLRGQVAVAWAYREALVQRLSGIGTDAAGHKKELENEITRMLPSGSRVELISTSGWDDPEAQLTATFKAEIPGFASSAGKRMLLPAGLFESNDRQPFSHGERKNPIYFSYPFYTMDDVQITVPTSLHVENLPQTAPLQTEFSFYKTTRGANGNVLSFTRDFAMGGIAFGKDFYPQLKSFYAGVGAGDSEQVVLTSASK